MLSVAPAQTSRFEKEQKKKEVEIIDCARGTLNHNRKLMPSNLEKKNQYCCVEVKNKLETCKSLE